MDLAVAAVRGKYGIRAENAIDLPACGKQLRISTARYQSGAIQSTATCGTYDGVCFTVAYGRGGDFTKLVLSNHARGTVRAIEEQQREALHQAQALVAEAQAYYASRRAS